MTVKESVAKMLDGKGAAGKLFVKLIIVLVLISTAAFMLNTEVKMHEKYEDLFTFCEMACVAVFTVEFALRMYSAKEGPFWFLFTPMALIDLAAILPSWLDALIPGDQFPAFQFLRIIRIFKFFSASKRGAAGAKAFQDSWDENRDLILAASMAGGAVWLVTAALQYLAERDNPAMIWCYPPPASGESLPLMGHSHESHESHESHNSSSDEHHEEHHEHVMNCVCDGDGCTGSDCLCQNRFKSIPAAMFLVIVNLSGEFPLAEQHSFYGRIIASFTAVMSVAVFAIPTGLVGAAIEGAVGALSGGDEKDYDVDDEDVAEILAEAGIDDEMLKSPAYTKTPFYKKMTGILICVSTVCSILGTVKSFRHGLGDDSVIGFLMFYVINVFLCLFYFSEWVMRVSTAGFLPTLKANLSWNWNMAQVDLMCWLPLAAHVIHTFMKGDSVVHADTDSGFAMIGAGSHAPYFPASITLSAALFQMIKFERYIHGFKILSRVLEKSQGVLMVGGAAAAVVLVFSSTMMYYAERNNPDPNMNKYYDSVPMAMWVTLLNLSGEVPLCDYTTVGSIIVGALSISACAIFAIPVGALGSGFEAVISEITSEQEAHENAEEENPLLPVTNPAAAGAGGGTEMTKYGAVPQSDSTDKVESEVVEKKNELTTLQRLVEGRGPRGERFMLISLIATLFAVSLEVWSTVDYAALVPKEGDIPDGYESLFWGVMPSADTNLILIEWAELVVVAWFTIEYIVRTSANGTDYTFSQLGAIDFVSTFPYFAAKGLLGSSIADTMDVYDGPLRALRILRLVRLDSYVPSLTLIDDAVRNCWAGLSVAIFAGVVIWFQFNEMLYFAETTSTTFPAASATTTTTAVHPDFSKQQGREEREPFHLKFNKCRDSGEAYGAAYLISKEHLFEQFTDYNLTWVNCEMGSFIMMNQRAHPAKDINGSYTQSLDVFDFSVVHLSAYERLQRRWSTTIGPANMDVGNITPIKTAVEHLKKRAVQQRNLYDPLLLSPATLAKKGAHLTETHRQTLSKQNRTVTIMPFLGYEMGAGHSNLGNRFVYLQACFWSLYAHFPHVTVEVKSQKDYDFCKHDSGLPFFDVVLMEGLPKSASLPVSTVKHAKARMTPGGDWQGNGGDWAGLFDYVYFTESDQILMMRTATELFGAIDRYPRRLMIPHRLMPYPVPVLKLFHKRNLENHPWEPRNTPWDLQDPFAWEKMNCCLERQNCWDRKTWLSVKDERVPIVNLYGIRVPLGNSNFHAEQYRTCTLVPEGGVEVCP